MLPRLYRRRLAALGRLSVYERGCEGHLSAASGRRLIGAAHAMRWRRVLIELLDAKLKGEREEKAMTSDRRVKQRQCPDKQEHKAADAGCGRCISAKSTLLKIRIAIIDGPCSTAFKISTNSIQTFEV